MLFIIGLEVKALLKLQGIWLQHMRLYMACGGKKGLIIFAILVIKHNYQLPRTNTLILIWYIFMNAVVLLFFSFDKQLSECLYSVGIASPELIYSHSLRRIWRWHRRQWAARFSKDFLLFASHMRTVLMSHTELCNRQGCLKKKRHVETLWNKWWGKGPTRCYLAESEGAVFWAFLRGRLVLEPRPRPLFILLATID